MTEQGEQQQHPEQQPQLEGKRKVRPVITQDAFSGEASESWHDWLGHFESVARVNNWDESTCLMWLEVRLTGKATTLGGDSAMKPWRLSGNALNQIVDAKFTWRSFKQESVDTGSHWEELADNIRLLADKAFPDLEDRAKEQLSLDRYLALLDKPEVALAVR